MAFVGDDARQGAAAVQREHHLLRRQRFLGHAANALDPDKSRSFDLAHDKTELVHVRDQHHGRFGFVAVERRDEIAEPIATRRQTEFGEFGFL